MVDKEKDDGEGFSRM